MRRVENDLAECFFDKRACIPLIETTLRLPGSGHPKRRIWRKIHIGINEKTLEVRALDVTGSNIGDAPILPDLLCQSLMARDFDRQVAELQVRIFMLNGYSTLGVPVTQPAE